MTIRVLIADDHPVFRHGVRAALSADNGLEVVGEADNGPDAVTLAESTAADVVLMDLSMPGGGIEATRDLVARMPAAAVLVLTMFDNSESLFEVMRAGAKGYLVKGADEEEIRRAIYSVAAGEVVFGAGIASRALAHFSAAASVGGRGGRVFPELTDREVDILELVAGGLVNAEIARRLFLSDKTVRNYVSTIMLKLQSHSRSEVIVQARHAGLGGAAREVPGAANGPA
ncbi:response regulator transcription factor [Rathayibacter soli]|uniref:response regulator transcription factor n=1 Tax=Rathayibacter soli TaxID=3144168 RepID=UPI0027E4C943|nr:response regulator transcription factor [Glaciibacter superstes]